MSKVEKTNWFLYRSLEWYFEINPSFLSSLLQSLSFPYKSNALKIKQFIKESVWLMKSLLDLNNSN